MSLASDRISRENLDAEDYLIARIDSIEAQTIDWMTKATALYGKVAVGDQQQILDHRTNLIAKLNAATAI